MLLLKNCKWGFLSCYICLQKPLQFGNNNNNNNVTILWERNKKRPIQNLCKWESCPKEGFSTHTCFPDSAAFTSAEITGLSLLVRYRVAFIATTWWRRRRKKESKNKKCCHFVQHRSCVLWKSIFLGLSRLIHLFFTWARNHRAVEVHCQRDVSTRGSFDAASTKCWVLVTKLW